MVRRREDEVLDIIKEDPLISQKEIADRLNITRSSVGVHVNNLTKKGKIVGRGYVLSKLEKVCVIGASNIDVYGMSSEDLSSGYSNNGAVEISVGGVGRNIAENVVKLGVHADLITAISNDEYGDYIHSYCLKEGVRIDKSNIFKNQRTSFYVAILDKDSNLIHGVSDMSIISQITPAFINQRKSDINNSRLIIIDLNLPKSTIDFILATFKNKKVLIDPVSANKLDKIKGSLKNIGSIKLNFIELEALSGISINGEEDVEKACNSLLDLGLKEMYITDENGSLYYYSKEKTVKSTGNYENIVNREGLREAEFAGIVYGEFNNLETEETLKIAQKSGTITCETDLTVSPWLNIENIYERLRDE